MSDLLLNQEEHVRKAEELVSSIGIPSQPQIVMDINREMSKPGADLAMISDIISKDVSMTAKLLKIANSPFFGLKEKVSSIQRALSLLGLKNFHRIILASSLRETLGGSGPVMEKFWSHSIVTASAAAHIAGKTGLGYTDEAYLSGLFHDCGIPLMMKKFPDYTLLVDYALGVAGSASLSGAIKSIIGIEDERYSTHHCAIGYLVAKSWHLPPVVTTSILHHHYINIDIHEDLTLKKLSATLILADYISSYLLFIGGSSCSVDPEPEWAKSHKKILSELSMSVEDVIELKEDLTDKLSK